MMSQISWLKSESGAASLGTELRASLAFCKVWMFGAHRGPQGHEQQGQLCFHQEGNSLQKH